MDRGEIKQEILVRSGKTTTSAWLSEAYLNDWINQAHRWSAGFKPWPYTEGRAQTTYTGLETLDFEGYKADSFRFMTIDGKRIQKINFEDYRIFKEEQPDSSDRIYSDFGGLVYINVNMALSGTLIAYGQYSPANIPDGDGATADDVETVFTEHGDEGNQAIIAKVRSWIAGRENESVVEDKFEQKSRVLLEELWKRIMDEQFAYQTKDRGMFKRMDIIGGQYDDERFKRDQF